MIVDLTIIYQRQSTHIRENVYFPWKQGWLTDVTKIKSWGRRTKNPHENIQINE